MAKPKGTVLTPKRVAKPKTRVVTVKTDRGLLNVPLKKGETVKEGVAAIKKSGSRPKFFKTLKGAKSARR